MALNTKIDGNPESCRSAGNWLKSTLANGVHDAGSQLYQVRNGSNGRWTGAAGEAFRQRMSECGKDTDELRDDARSAGGAFESLADDMETAQRRMQRARESAVAAELDVTDSQILHPGQGPGAPEALPTDGSATDEQRSAHADAVQAQNAHAAKVAAYNRLAGEVDGARGVWERGKSAFDSVANGLWDKRYLNAFSWTATFAGALEGRRLFWQKGADAWRAEAGKALRHLDETTQAARAGGIGNKLNFYKTIDAQHAQYYDALKHADDAAGKVPSGVLARINNSARSGTRSALSRISPALVSGGSKVLSKVPVVGLGVTAASVGMDINNGKEPGKAVVSGAAGFGAGMAAAGMVAAAGGPVGWGVGAGIAAGIGIGYAADYAWDNWMPDGAKDAINDGLSSAGNAIKDGAGAVGDAVGDAASGAADVAKKVIPGW
ncbi:MAG: hypothetical protein GEU98_21510 [Pseudonocardiaceae bacterium]|nr:hypothetical protein [Pseudonocardiaceae bacterium]